jgi:hypothetical protein
LLNATGLTPPIGSEKIDLVLHHRSTTVTNDPGRPGLLWHRPALANVASWTCRRPATCSFARPVARRKPSIFEARPTAGGDGCRTSSSGAGKDIAEVRQARAVVPVGRRASPAPRRSAKLATEDHNPIQPEASTCSSDLLPIGPRCCPACSTHPVPWITAERIQPPEDP